MVVRCTKKMLGLLGVRSTALSELPPADDDWYLNLVWIDRQKCLLLTHAGPLFSVFRIGVHVADLRPLGNYLVEAIEAELRAEGLPADTFSALEPDGVQLAKTASRSTLGFMTEMAFELGWIIADRRGPRRSDINDLNHALRPPDRTRPPTPQRSKLTPRNTALVSLAVLGPTSRTLLSPSRRISEPYAHHRGRSGRHVDV